MYSTNSCVEALTTNMTVLRDVAFRRWLGHRDEARVNGISAAVRDSQSSVAPSAMRMYSEKSGRG